MMKTPICDFVRRYAESGSLRLHMPGHKGLGPLGAEKYDITEIEGAGELYSLDGIVHESEENAGSLFGARTFYSAEGSSLCIRAMLYLAMLYAEQKGKRPLIAAGRNAHKSFLTAAALLDLDVKWLYPEKPDSYISCKLDAPSLDAFLSSEEEMPAAVYLTSPDYLGNLTDIRAISRICKKHGVLLLVDNAHGAYLKFLSDSLHPIDLGADMCCDSAHKTLPVLTGGAYLHISHNAPDTLSKYAKDALSLFGSTSPSYLILQSLDAANRYIADGYKERLSDFSEKTRSLKSALSEHGFTLSGDEPLKITIRSKPYGYTGTQLAALLRENGIVCEFSDPDFVVMMLTPETGVSGLERLRKALLEIPKREPVTEMPPEFRRMEQATSIRQAAFSARETVPASESLGRIMASATVGCPPAVPIVVCGERIDENAVRCLYYYNITSCTVVK